MYEYTQEIRDFINNARRKYGLLENQAQWSQLCSCLDVIEDSDLAIDAYSSLIETVKAGGFGASDGERYLVVYGLLQALFAQQDAAFNLCEALKIPETLNDYPRLKEIREIRNASVGHPTKKDRPKSRPISYNFISRPTLGLGGFQLLSNYSDGKSEFKNVSIHNLIADQKKYISDILTLVKRKLEDEEVAHKEKFKTEKLAPILDCDYHFGTILGAVRTTHEPIEQDRLCALSAEYLKSIKQRLASFQESLARRGIGRQTQDYIDYVYELLEYSLDELERFFQSVISGGQPNINEKAAHIFTFFAEKQVAELRNMAREIDEDYSS